MAVFNTRWGECVRLVGTRDAQVVSGLSADQIREWTGRRGLVSPEIPAKGKGTQARYSWQSLLLLRVCAALKTQIHVELSAYRNDIKTLQDQINNRSFHSLWNETVIFGPSKPFVMELRQVPEFTFDKPYVLVLLRPHLQIIKGGLGIEKPTPSPLFFQAVGLG